MIEIKTTEEIKIMKEGGKILAEIIQKISETAKPGITTDNLNKLASELVFSLGVKPAFLNYNNFPATVCLSVNEEVVHGVPGNRVLMEGDILGIDMGIIYKGFVTDSAVTVPVLGDMSRKDWVKKNPEVNRLVNITKEALYIGIKQAVIGNHIGAISHVIQNYVESAGFGVVRDLVGHGIGRKLHEEPAVPNYGNPKDGPELIEGMTIAIEPMTTLGDWPVRLAEDEQTYVTKDNSWSAHFEHTVAIAKKGPTILTI